MDWIRGERLGHGSFATVSLAVPKTTDFIPLLIMAVKSCGAALCSSLVNERLVLEDLKDCAEIIQCFGDGFSNENGEELYNLFLEYAPGGNLADKVRFSGERRLPEFEVRRYVRALLKGLRHIHAMGYVHCDIKLQNILLDSSGGVKIADFGLAKRGAAGGGAKLRGTPMYMSPEMVSCGEQGAAADIWALGCVVSEMIGGSPAWRCSGDMAGLLMRIGSGEEDPDVPGIMSEEGKDFLRKCFEKDSNKRWTAEMLLCHPFVDGQDFTEYDAPSVSPRCPFEFPACTSPARRSITSLPLPGNYENPNAWTKLNWVDNWAWSICAAERMRRLVTDQGCDWSVTEGWVTVR